MEIKIEKQIYADINAVGETEKNLRELVRNYENQGADGYYIYDFSSDEAVRERFLHLVRAICLETELPFVVGVYAKRFEDVKKAVYTGANRVYLRPPVKAEVRKEAIDRFGEKIGLELDYSKGQCEAQSLDELWQAGIRSLCIKHVELEPAFEEKVGQHAFSIMVRDSLMRNDLTNLMMVKKVGVVATNFYQGKDIRRIKHLLQEQGVSVSLLESSLCFSDFKKGPDGLVPAIVQDYRTNEVLMLAYMNEESYNKTLETGKMTYYSRSRRQLWCKGETSGHYQYVKELSIDCDKDTLLAKVRQVGAACHTGNRSCFYTKLAAKTPSVMPDAIPEGRPEKRQPETAEASVRDNFSVFSEVYETILDRKRHPREGSYTNYLFDKGIDKILKKCGEESAEVIIAAKNPDAMELKYEIADYLYHLMVLMVETGLTWEEITGELANRH